MRVRLIKKLAEAIDGVNLADRAVGDVMDLDAQEAELLIAERWALPEGPSPVNNRANISRPVPKTHHRYTST